MSNLCCLPGRAGGSPGYASRLPCCATSTENHFQLSHKVPARCPSIKLSASIRSKNLPLLIPGRMSYSNNWTADTLRCPSNIQQKSCRRPISSFSSISQDCRDIRYFSTTECSFQPNSREKG